MLLCSRRARVSSNRRMAEQLIGCCINCEVCRRRSEWSACRITRRPTPLYLEPDGRKPGCLWWSLSLLASFSIACHIFWTCILLTSHSVAGTENDLFVLLRATSKASLTTISDASVLFVRFSPSELTAASYSLMHRLYLLLVMEIGQHSSPGSPPANAKVMLYLQY